MSVIKVNQSNFDEILAGKKPALLDFYADWCGPCRMVAPIIEQIALEHPEYLVGKINVDENPELAQKYGVFSIPTLAVVKDGHIAGRLTGANPKEKILELFD